MGYRIPWQRISFLYLVGISMASSMCDDEELCESSGDDNFEASGSPDFNINDGDKDIRMGTDPTPGVIDLFTGRKFLAAVVSGSCVGLLLASMAMMLVLCKARRDNSLRRYNYQQGTKNELFA